MTLLIHLPIRNAAHDNLRAWSAVPDTLIDVGAAALSLGVLPERLTDSARYRDQLDRLAIEIAQVAHHKRPHSVEDIAAILIHVIRDRYGYQAEPSDLPQAASLPRVLEKKTGLPLAIALLYVSCARAVGWGADLLNFPDAALLRLEYHGRRLILNIAQGGSTVTILDLRQMVKIALGEKAEIKPDYYAPLSNRDLLLRLQTALKLRYLRLHRDEEVSLIIEGLLFLAPEKATLWREFGLALTRLGEEHRAVIALENYMVLVENDNDYKDETTQLLEQLKSLIAIGC